MSKVLAKIAKEQNVSVEAIQNDIYLALLESKKSELPYAKEFWQALEDRNITLENDTDTIEAIISAIGKLVKASR